MDFPEQMIEELLVRLPLKLITKFKCVSKDWNNLISGPEFRRLYQSRHRNTCAFGLVYHPQRPLFPSDACKSAVKPPKFINMSKIENEEQSFLSHDMQEFGYIVGSSNGLLLLTHNHTSYYVYDVLTKKHVRLPETLTKEEFTTLAFICKERQQNYPNNGDNNSSYLSYKVVRVGGARRLSKKETMHNVQTYSSETGKWHKSMMISDTPLYFPLECPAKVIGNTLWWVDFFKFGIIAYDLEDPDGRAKYVEFHRIGKVVGTQDGCLLCITNSKYAINLRVMDFKYEGASESDEEISCSSYLLFHSINYMELGLGFNIRVIDVHLQDSLIFLESATEIISYDLNKKSIEIIRTKREKEAIYFHFEWPSWPCL